MIDDTIKKVQDETKQAVPETPVKTEPDVVDVDLGFVEKRKFRICGDFNRMLELNVSDLNIFARLNEGYPKLQTLMNEAKDA